MKEKYAGLIIKRKAVHGLEKEAQGWDKKGA
jgi:hypothetical protein